MGKNNYNNASWLAQQRRQLGTYVNCREKANSNKRKSPAHPQVMNLSSDIETVSAFTLPAVNPILISQLNLVNDSHRSDRKIPHNQYLYLFFMIILFANKVFAQECHIKTLKKGQLKAINERLDEITTVESSLPEPIKTDVIKGCNTLKRSIMGAIKRDPDFRRVATGIFFSKKHPQPQIICEEKIKEAAAAYFSPPENKIYFQALGADENGYKELITTKHEFYHAYNFNLKHKCPVNDDSPSFTPRKSSDFFKTAAYKSVIPVYPITDNQIEEYSQAFNRGDERTAKFISFFEQAVEKKLITINEKGSLVKSKEIKQLLASWKEMEELVTGYLEIIKRNDKFCGWTPTDKSIYNQLILRGWKDNEINSVQIESYEIKKIRKSQQDGSKIYELFSCIDFTLESLKSAALSAKEESLKNPGYKSFTPGMRLAEREALTFQGLDEKLMWLFYREACEIRQAYLDQCGDRKLDSLYNSCLP